jgi:hypothetical protein
MALIIAVVSITVSLFLKFIKNFKKDTRKENLELIKSLNTTECPECGTRFKSIPKYCFNCNHLIENELGERIGKAK